MHGLFYQTVIQVLISSVIHFLRGKNVAPGIFLTTLGSRTRGQMFYVVVDGSGHFFSSEDKVPPVLLHSSRSCREQKQNSCLEWVGSVETFKRKLHRREFCSILNVFLVLHVSERV